MRSAPSSSRTLERRCLATKNATSSGTLTFSAAAFFIRMATRISSSGGSMATVSPESKREISRSSMPVISFGYVSLVMITCARLAIRASNA
ncbi:hypothetical protein D3C72_2119360 [compost metagenome]